MFQSLWWWYHMLLINQHGSNRPPCFERIQLRRTEKLNTNKTGVSEWVSLFSWQREINVLSYFLFIQFKHKLSVEQTLSLCVVVIVILGDVYSFQKAPSLCTARRLTYVTIFLFFIFFKSVIIVVLLCSWSNPRFYIFFFFFFFFFFLGIREPALVCLQVK